jgi:post-segregation antitoxin (ccd killing protein)
MANIHALITSPVSHETKKTTNVSINEPLLTAARSLKINASKAAELGTFKAAADKKESLITNLGSTSGYARSVFSL